MPKLRQYTDHLGHTYPTLTAMAKHWNIPTSTLQRRLDIMKLTIEQALTFTEQDCKQLSKQCKDHLGNIYPSKKAMCDHYNINTQIYFGRIKLKWSLKDALTTPVNKTPKNAKFITDHTGTQFTSVSQLCKHWNIKRSTYNARIKAGWSQEKTLTTPCEQITIKQKKCKDHLGNIYPSQNAMCKHYGITHHTFTTRMNKLGWSLKDALTKQQVINAISSHDTFGHTFPTLRDMAHYYNIQPYKLQGKTFDDKTLRKILTSGFKPNTKIGNLTIKKCINFPYYIVETRQHEIMMHYDTILNTYHNIFHPLPDRKIQDKELIINECIGFPNYNVTYKNQQQTWSYWDIIEHTKQQNFGIHRPQN